MTQPTIHTPTHNGPRIFVYPDGQVFLVDAGAQSPQVSSEGPLRVVADGICLIDLHTRGPFQRLCAEVPVDRLRDGTSAMVAVPAATAKMLSEILPTLRFEQSFVDTDPQQAGDFTVLHGLLGPRSIHAAAQQIRGMGAAVSTWSSEDLEFIDDDPATENLTDHQLALLKEDFISSLMREIEDRLSSSGNEVLSILWDQNRSDLVSEAKAYPEEAPPCSQAQAMAQAVQEDPPGQYEVTVLVSVTADSREQAAAFAMDDLRDFSLGPWNLEVRNMSNGQQWLVSAGEPPQEPDYTPRPN